MNTESADKVNRLYYNFCKLQKQVKQNKRIICDVKANCCNEDEYSWFLETATGPTGPVVDGPFEIENKEHVRLYSNTIDITAQEGSTLVGLEVKGGIGGTGATGPAGVIGPTGAAGVTGPTGQQGQTGAPFTGFLGCGLTGTLGFGGTVETDLHCAEIAFVDGKLGDDGMAVIADICRPFRTIQAAINAQVAAGNNMDNIFHALVYVKPALYDLSLLQVLNKAIQMVNNVDVYCEPGVVIRNPHPLPYFFRPPSQVSIIDSPTAGISWRWYGKAIFGSTKWLLTISGGGENVYFEFLESGGIDTNTNTLVGGQIILRNNSNPSVRGNVVIRGDRLISAGAEGAGNDGYAISCDNGRGYNLDVEIKHQILSTGRNAVIGTQNNGGTTQPEMIIRCPRIEVWENSQAPQTRCLFVNNANVTLTINGNMTNYSSATGNDTACIGVANIGTTYKTKITINGNLDGRQTRAITTATGNNNTVNGGKIIINGNVINDPTANVPLMLLGWIFNDGGSNEFCNVIINNGYIQGGSGDGTVVRRGHGTIHLMPRTKLWLNNCILKNQKSANNVAENSIVVVDDTNNPSHPLECYMSYCTGEVTGNTGATGLFVHEEVGNIDFWGVVDSKCNTSADPPDPWGGFTVIPSFIVADIN